MFANSCYKEEILIPKDINQTDFLKFDGLDCGIDFDRQLVLISIQPDFLTKFNPLLFTDFLKVNINGIDLSTGDSYNFSDYQFSDSIPISITTNDRVVHFCYIYFTSLPVIQIKYNATINKDSKILCQFIFSDFSVGSEGDNFISDAGIKIRGGSSSWLPKKSYRIELWKDTIGFENNKESLAGMRNDDDWILDAMYIDKARMRNKVSMELWRDMSQQSDNREIQGKKYIDSKYTEVFVNNKYVGLYCLNERFDRKQLDITKSDFSPEGLIYKAENYSSVTLFKFVFDTTSSRYWGGFDQIYPNPNEYICWTPLYNFVKFVVSSSDAVYSNELSDYISIESAIDYFLLMNISKANDNTGKNIIYTRKNSISPFTMLPWDMDAAWGRDWDSSFLSFNDTLENAMYIKLFKNNVEDAISLTQTRWHLLQETILSPAELSRYFRDNAEILTNSGAFKREKERWPEANLNLQQEMDYINQWILDRSIWLNEYIESMED